MKDADNLVKGLLDSMQGVLYLNDRLVQCLTSRRIEYAGPAGHYVVSARAGHGRPLYAGGPTFQPRRTDRLTAQRMPPIRRGAEREL
jgi:Endodeoxyribonuclease RusA